MAKRLDAGDDDEFDSLFDDQSFLDPELEESLAQVEATYTASQVVQPPPKPSTSHAATPSNTSFRLNTDSYRPTNRRGTFVQPSAKRQRLDPGPSNLSHVVGPSKPSTRRALEPEPDQVIVRNLRDEDFGDNDDDQWWATNNALDQVEEEAIRMSQQPASQPHASTPTNNSHSNTSRLPQESHRNGVTARKPPDPDRNPATNAAAPRQNPVDNDELEKLRAEVERLRSAQKAQEEMVDKLKQEAYRKSGEVSVVRQNLTKLNQENSQLREREVLREQEHKAALDRLQKDQERRLQRLETETAFRRVEQDTSRRIWPSSVARLPPVGLRDVDRRQESQVRAGLTTPTKANRFGVRGSGSSGNRQRFAETPADRDEPGTPTRSTTKPAPVFPRPPTAGTSASKTKAFRGLQNSFADFGPVQDKIRQQQRQSPSKPPKTGTLAPADWDAEQDQTMAFGGADHADIVMVDRPGSPFKTTATAAQHDPQMVQTSSLSAKKEYSYLAAVSEILHRRTTIVSLLLSHASYAAAAPNTYPSNRFNPSGSHPQKQTSGVPNTSTLSRLISANLVSDCPKLLLFRYRKAVETLLTQLSTARVMEPKEREDAFSLLPDPDAEIDVEEITFAFATMQLSQAIASSLMVMAGVLLRTCQTDLLTDVLRLVSCLVSMLPRFWMDAECLKTDTEAKRSELSFLGSNDADAQAQWARLSTPIQLREILAQCLDDCRPPLGSGDAVSSASRAVDSTQGKYSELAEEQKERLEVGNWILSSEAREDLLHAVVQTLEAMSQCPDASLSSSHHPLRLLQRPGTLHKLLHPDRSSFIISNVVRMLSSAVSNAPLVHECLASKADPLSTGRVGSHSSGPRANARFPVLELLVKHLVDRRFDLPEREWHPFHCGILTFLTQAALRSADTLIVLADSAALLAALIRCLSWTQISSGYKADRPSCYHHAIPASDQVQSRQQLRFLILRSRPGSSNRAHRYEHTSTQPAVQLSSPLSADHRFERASPGAQERMGSISLATKLDQPETYSMLNGIRQSFIVALSRIAFCSEPDWIASERKLLANLLPDLRKRAAKRPRKFKTRRERIRNF